MVIGTYQAHQIASAREENGTYEQLKIFGSVLDLVQRNYVEEIPPKKLIYGAVQGMLKSLDPHSSFMKPEDYKELQIETKGSFTGIGIEISLKDGILTVVSPIEGTPAYKAGLKANDKILKIEGKTTKNMTLIESVKLLRGAKGTDVTISIYREGWRRLKDVTLTRDIIPIKSVRSRMLEEGYGYIRISNFQNKTTFELKKALKELEKGKGLKGLVLDLRNNPGGLLDQAVKVADVFL
ncbi:MAG: PDZ domain-containing protein, partial [Deltaproteobacteria bacterium]|nr:PDZ domain-containing protein [Deltaproteobacteria bacterium]